MDACDALVVGGGPAGSSCAWALERAGLDPSFLIGGIAENFGSSFRWTGGDIFCIEGI